MPTFSPKSPLMPTFTIDPDSPKLPLNKETLRMPIENINFEKPQKKVSNTRSTSLDSTY